jgi:hypothetical protein
VNRTHPSGNPRLGAQNGPILRNLLVLAGALAPYAFLLAQQSAAPTKVSFGRDVAPILKAHCTSCHGSTNPDGGLDLLDAKKLLKGGDSGPAVTPGKPESSLLLQRIEGKGGLPRMPKGMPPLSSADTQTIRNWIAAGAKIDDAVARHWAYVAPVRPPVPKIKSTWIRNPIDAFVLAKMTREGLHPSPEASKETLIRRVSLDLTGLPPTLDEIDVFLADKRPDAYERLVDRLLASPHYGERQARGWLDLARYADTDGFEKDLNRTAWKYRDWVIDAFNKNLPYKDFVVQQIAGDMFPNATLDEKIATGFNRNTMFNREGGVDQEEAHFGVILDRVDTTATVFLGSTLQCARCHDHKYDPFTQRDYYKMAAFFSNSRIAPSGPKAVGEEKWFEPDIPAPSQAQAADLARIQTALSTLDAQYKTWSPDKQTGFDAWKIEAAKALVFQSIAPSQATSDGGAKLVTQPDQSVLATGNLADNDVYHLTFPAAAFPIAGFKLEALTDPSLHSNGPGRADNGNFVVTGMKVFVAGRQIGIVGVQADYSQPDFDPKTIAGSDRSSGWAVMPEQGQNHELQIALAHPIPAGASFSVDVEHQAPALRHLLGRFRFSVSPDADSASLQISGVVRQLAAKPTPSVEEEQTLKEAFLSVSPSLGSTRAQIASLRQSEITLQRQIPTAMVLEEIPNSPVPFAYVRQRGQFLTKTDRVIAGTPDVLPPLPSGRPDRLALGKWLVSPSNPLTARVEVNRIWEQCFGRGIVETSEDFGTRGSPPTHPELLDWLAVEFMHQGWDMKAMNRLIVTSATYRQTSDATPEIMAKDPQNFLYARGPRFRMEAETIHDNALAVSGLLSLKIGGPSVMPYQPEGIWDSPYSGEQWMPSMGQDRYRRGIYTFIKRTAPYPAFLTLDATSRESCTVRRIRTNTPLQALELLNDKLMLEAAKALAHEMEHAATTDSQRLALGFRLCTARLPQPKEENRLKTLLAKLETRYRTNPKAASALGNSYEDAAYTMVGNVLLNLDETITKG